MALAITRIGHPLLKRPTAPVTEFGEAIERHLPEMLDIMREEGGVGLAANQAGLDLSFAMVVANVDDDDREEDEILVLVNPESVESSKKTVIIEEGCLSVPGLRADVTRPERIRVRYQDIRGETQELETGDFLARVIQHEVDHLRGVLFIERLSSAKKALIRREVEEIKAKYAQ